MTVTTLVIAARSRRPRRAEPEIDTNAIVALLSASRSIPGAIQLRSLRRFHASNRTRIVASRRIVKA
jgi:hypothetical protein